MATADLLVDTDVLVDHLRGRHRLSAAVGSARCLGRLPVRALRRPDEPQRLRRLLSSMIELPVDAEIAELAGVTRRRTGIATPDALIAATALVHAVPVMTRNRRHFALVEALQLVTPS